MMNWKGFGTKRPWPNFLGTNYPDIRLGGLRKITKNNPGPRKYEAGVLTTRLRRSVTGVSARRDHEK
jgi:hypothetical protein